MMLDTCSDPILKKDLYKLLVDVGNMKNDNLGTQLKSVVILPKKNNVTLFGVEAYVDPSRVDFLNKKMKEAGFTAVV